MMMNLKWWNLSWFFTEIFTETSNIGLCLGPELLISLYIGRLLNFLSEYSCNFVFASILVINDSDKLLFQKFKIKVSADLSPWSKKIAPINASRASLVIFSFDFF